MPQHRTSRGLALSAIGALSVACLTVAPALAAAPEARLLSVFNEGHYVSTRVDDEDTSLSTLIRLTAEVPDSGATVEFAYNPDPVASNADPGWLPISATLVRSGNFVSVEWSPSGLDDNLVAVRVAATADGTTYSTRQNVTVTGQGDSVNSVRLDATAYYFKQPYADSAKTASHAHVTGSTSASSGTVELSWWRSSDGTFQGQTDAAITNANFKVPGGSGAVAAGNFKGVLDISAFDTDASSILPIAAERDSDDVRPVTLVPQVVTNVAASQSAEPTSSGSEIYLTVTDGGGRRIIGAEVRRLSDGSLVGYTNTTGELSTVQPPDTTESYYVNTSDVDAFEEGTDKISNQIVTPEWVPLPTSTESTFADGRVFDRDEYALGDISLLVRDQEGLPVGEGIEIAWAIAAEGTDPESLTFTESDTDEDGRITIPFDPTAVPSGTYTLMYSTPPGSPAPAFHTDDFVVGQAVLTLNPAKGKAASGGQITYTGSLKVEGEPVVGRQISLTYTRGKELVPGISADAGILASGIRLTTAATTNAEGRFTVVIDDPAETGNPTETGGLLKAVATTAGASTTAGAEFGAGPGRAVVKLQGANNGRAADVVKVDGPPSVAGERVRLWRKIGKGKWTAVVVKTLDRNGDVRVSVPDKNGVAVTQYRVDLIASTRVQASSSNVLKVK